MKILNPGIKPKLLLAFGLVLATTLIATGIALSAFARLSESFGDIANKSVPFMAESMELTRLGMEISAIVPLLSAAQAPSHASANYELLLQSSAEIEQILIDKKAFDTDQRSIQASVDDVLKVRSFVEQLNGEVQARLTARENVDSMVSAVSVQQVEINQQLLDAIDFATMNFVDVSKTIFSENDELIDTLLNTYVEAMIGSLRLQGRVSELHSLLVKSLDGSQLSQRVEQMREASMLAGEIREIRQNLDVQRVSDLDAFDTALARLGDLAQGENSLFLEQNLPYSQIRINTIIRELQPIDALVSKSLSLLVDSSYFMVFQSGRELTNSVNVALPELMGEGVDKLVSLLDLRAELNTLAGILALVPQVASTEDLKPLMDRYMASQESLSGIMANFGAEEGIEGVIEKIENLLQLGSVSTGIFSFQKNVLEKANSIASVESQLNATQNVMLDRLFEQVNLSRAHVEEASDNVNEMINAGRIELMIVSALSFLITLLVYWFLVSKNLLARLLQTITALRSIANGDFDVSVNSSGADELADLARTVEVFRHSALESQMLQEKQVAALEDQRALEHDKTELDRVAREEQLKRHEKEQAEAVRQQAQAVELQHKVDRLMDAVMAAAQGDLNHPIDVSGEDLAGQMGRALESLFSELRASMSGINQNAEQLTRASEKLTCLSVGMNEMASTNTENAQEAASLTSDVGSSVDSVAGATEQMSSSIKEIARNTTESETVAREAVVLAKSTDATVRKLAESSAGIGSVIKVITSIAEQTNLLALNATIEAARAGDAGKGFAVVANEVKELAKETAKATEQIESRISDIQSDTDSAVSAIESISKIIERISGIQSAIAVAIDEQSSVTQEISRSIVQTASGSEAISTLIEGVAEKAQSNQQASDEVSTAAGELSDMALQLQKLVQRFAIDKTHVITLKAA